MASNGVASRRAPITLREWIEQHLPFPLCNVRVQLQKCGYRSFLAFGDRVADKYMPMPVVHSWVKQYKGDVYHIVVLGT